MATETDEINNTEIAILQTTCNKYSPGIQTFKLQSLVGLEDNSSDIITTNLSTSNLLNENSSDIPISTANKATTIDLEVPKEIAAHYPTKYIPPGTRFIVSFTSGDITKPIIVGREF
jgi:hypothetical protein